MNLFHFSTQNTDFRKRVALLIISFTLLFSVLIIIATPPAAGYELSMYEAYPALLWVLISINIFFSIYLILLSCDSESKNLYYGYFSILLIEAIMLILPNIRGYYSTIGGWGDMYYHMFAARQIINSGDLSLYDIYPIMHIWLSNLYNFLPDFILLIAIFSIVFFIVYILSLYILGKTILGTKKGGIFVSIFGIPLIFSFLHYSFIPFFFAILMFPLILYIYQKMIRDSAQKNSYYICLIFLAFFIVFCHPMVSVFLIIMFSLFACFELFKRRAISWHSNIEAVNIVIIVSLTVILWWFQFRNVLEDIKTMAFALIGQGTFTSIFENQMNEVSTSNASIWLVIDRFVKVYGPTGIYFLISLLFIGYIMYQYFQNRKIYDDDLIYSLQFCVAICIGIALMTGYFVIAEPIRAAMYGLVFATILCGIFCYRLRHLEGLITSITVITTIVCILTIMTLHTSPLIGGPNSALTYGDKNGIDWILEYRNAEIPIVQEDLPYDKYAEYYFETMNARPQRVSTYSQNIPSHFGYTTNSTIGNSLTYLDHRQLNMITTERMRLTPYAVPADRRSFLKSFTEKDFDRLKNDPTVNLVYLSNKFNVWNIAVQ